MNFFRRFKFEIIISLVFIIVALVFTFPLVLNLRTQVYDYKGDLLEALWYAWWVKYAWQHDELSPQQVPIVASPFGIDLSQDVTKNISLSFANYPLLILTVLVDEIFAYNFLMLLTFPLAGITMYLLVYYLTKNRWGSFLAGLAFSFCPYHFAHASHITLANIQWMPLFVLYLFKLHNERTFVSAALCGLFFALTLLSDTYYGYFMLVVTATFIIFKLFRKVFNKRRTSFTPQVGLFKNLLLVVTTLSVASLACFPYIYPILKSYIFEAQLTPWLQTKVRPISHLHIYSAKLFDYILPDVNHPVFGSFTQRFVGSIFYGESLQEHSLYLGLVIISLAIFGYRFWNNRNKFEIQDLEEREKRDFPIKFFALLILVAFLFSLPPKFMIFGTYIKLPSYYIFKIMPFFGPIARFGIVIMLSLCVLAGVGFTFLIKRQDKNWKKIICGSFLTLLLVFEFLNIPPFKTIDISFVPEVYKWLKTQEGDFIVAEYPLGNDVEYLFYQRVHKKRLVNGAQPKTEAFSVKEEIEDILNPEATQILRELEDKYKVEIRYVILHLDRYPESERLAINEKLEDFKEKFGLDLVKEFNDIKVFRLRGVK